MADRKEPPFYNDHSVGASGCELPLYGSMEVLIQTLTGTSFRLRVAPLQAVVSVKAEIQRLEGIPVAQQHLIWNHVELEDEHCLQDYGVADGCTLRLVLALRGGPINTRRVTVEEPLKEVSDLVEGSREELWGGGGRGGGRRLTFLVYHHGDQLTLVRMVARDDGTLSPLSSVGGLSGEAGGPSRALQQNLENSVTMNKMRLLRTKMDDMTLNKKKSAKLKPRPPARLFRTLPRLTHLPPILPRETAGPPPPSAAAPSSVHLSPFSSSSSSSCSMPQEEEPREARPPSPSLQPPPSPSSSRFSPPPPLCPRGSKLDQSPAVVSQEPPGTLSDSRLLALPAGSRASGSRGPAGSRASGAGGEAPGRGPADRRPSAFPSAAGRTPGASPVAPGVQLFQDDLLRQMRAKTSSLGSGAAASSRLGSGAPASSRLGSGAAASSRLGSGAAASSRLGSGAPASSRLGSGTPAAPPARRRGTPAYRLPPVRTPSNKKSCKRCGKKTGLASSYQCRCGNNFCGAHRYAETHGCCYDYKAAGRLLLHRANPLVSGPKLPKI